MARGSHFGLEVRKVIVLQTELQQRILADRTAQKQQQTWESDNTVRYGSHWGGSP